MNTRKRKRNGRNSRSFLKEYDFEILVVGLLGLGFFLLWEEWNIKSITWYIITNTTQNLIYFSQNILYKLIYLVEKVETSDIIGISLILIAIGLILHRARMRIIRFYPEINKCLKCDESLHRIHRNYKYKLIGLILNCKIKRYKCKKCPFEDISMIRKGITKSH